MKKNGKKECLPPGSISKILVRMKLLTFFVFISMATFASNTYSQQTKFNMKLNGVSVKEVFQKIEENSKFILLYNENQLNSNRKVDIDAKNESVEAILDQVFEGTSNSYKIYDRQIVILSPETQKLPSVIQSELGQTKNVSGKVTDLSGFPLPGVTVIIKGTTNGTITDPDGNYTIGNVPENATLVFSFVGMITQEIPVAGKQTINVTLEEETIGLGEVVAIGYGTAKRRDITGSVASVTGDQLAAIPVQNAAQALKGKLPGVNVTTQDGRPDAEISIRVRGGGSITQSNDPLFIVDGFPVSTISDIPGDQIESIDVLKDASSTAIYGARGANGVIIVTTKSGKLGKLKVTYDGYAQFNVAGSYGETMSAYDYIAYNWAYAAAISDNYADAWEMLWGIGRYSQTYNPEGIDHYKNVAATNFSKEVWGDSFSHNHNFNISSGTENTKYIISINHVDDDGAKINSWYKRTNASFKLDQKMGKKLNFSLNTRFVQIEKTGDEATGSAGGSLLSTAYWFRPIATKDIMGVLDQQINSQIGFYDDILQDVFNPVARINDYTKYSRTRSLRANTAFSWEILDGLVAKTELGLSVGWGRDKTWEGAIYSNYFDNAGNKTFGGNATIRASESWDMRWVNTLSYDVRGLGDKQSLTLLAGMEVADSGSEYIETWGSAYPASFDMDRAYAMMGQYLTSEDAIYGGLSSNVGTPGRLQSYFGRANYSLNDKYLLTATFRADGSSRFAPTNRWGYFPAGAIAWRMSEEPFMQDATWLDNLKVRLSFGSVGNDAISANLWKQNWKSSSSLTDWGPNETQQKEYVPESSTIANPDLKWETTITRNLGFDFAFMDNRLYGTLDIYKNTTKDLLMQTPVTAVTGFSYTFDNIGQTSNKGIELSLGSDIIRSNDFNLRASINININRGNVDELAPGINGLYNSQWGGTSYVEPVSGDYILEVGKPVGQVRGFTYDGWYTVDDFNYVDGQYILKDGIADAASGLYGAVYGTTSNKPSAQTAYPGVLKLKDIAGPDGSGPDGIVDENDLGVIGDMTPKHTGGFNISGDYKAFDFSLDFNWSYGNQIYNANYLYGFAGNKEIGLYRNRLDYLSTSYKIYDIQGGNLVAVTDPAALKTLNANATTFLPFQENTLVSDLGIDDGSFLRLNTVTLGYTLPESILVKTGIDRLRIYGSIYNALTFTKYGGQDPEVSTNNNMRDSVYPTPGLDYGAYPRPRSFTLGLNIEF